MHHEIQMFSLLDQDVLISQLRSQSYKLKTISENLENEKNSHCAGALVKEVEVELRRIRKTWLEN